MTKFLSLSPRPFFTQNEQPLKITLLTSTVVSRYISKYLLSNSMHSMGKPAATDPREDIC